LDFNIPIAFRFQVSLSGRLEIEPSKSPHTSFTY
jgi:hypothetical protein